MAGDLKAIDARQHAVWSDSLEQKPDRVPLNDCLLQGLALLYRAYQYAESVGRQAWDFAVEIDRLRDIGLGDCDFRLWEVLKLTEHAQEVTRVEDDGREFRPVGNLSFPPRTCFILTAAGAERVRSEMGQQRPADSDRDLASDGNPSQPSPKPIWDTTERTLEFNGQLVKQFKWPAVNQETVLAAFEEEGWPARIDDPLPPQGNVNPKRRLHDTIKHLNKNQHRPLIHFRGDGTGEGVIWEVPRRPTPTG